MLRISFRPTGLVALGQWCISPSVAATEFAISMASRFAGPLFSTIIFGRSKINELCARVDNVK